MDSPRDDAAAAVRTDADQVSAVGVLGEPTRRAIYEYVAANGGWVGRDEASDSLGLGRATAAHHLDRLVESGLLEADYQRLTARSGPGAGRPAKIYRRAGVEIGVTLPPRDYELASKLLARVVEAAGHGEHSVSEAVRSEPAAEGERFAEEMRTRVKGLGRSADARLQVVLGVLTDHGYEPARADDSTILLRNCPFHRLAEQHTDLVCGMNVELLRSAVEGFGRTGYAAEFEPEDGLCCVRLKRSR